MSNKEQVQEIIIKELSTKLKKAEHDRDRYKNRITKLEEVFEKINERLCTFIFENNSPDYLDGYTDAVEEICDRLDEIAKEMRIAPNTQKHPNFENHTSDPDWN